MFLSIVNAFSDGIHIYLELVGAALLRVVVKVDPPPVKFTPALWRSWHMPIRLFIFTSLIPTPGIFSCAGFSDMYDLDSLLSDSFFRVLLRLNFSKVIGGGCEVFRKSFPRNLACMSCPIYSGMSNIVSGYSTVHMTARLEALFLGGLAFPSGPCDDRRSKLLVGIASLRPE